MVGEKKLKLREEEINRILEERGETFYVKFASPFKCNRHMAGYALADTTGEFRCCPVAYYTPQWDSLSDRKLADYLTEYYTQNARQIDYKQIFDRDFVLKSVYPKVVSGINKLSLEETGTVHEKLLDMYVTFYVLLSRSEQGQASTTLTDRFLEHIGLTYEEVRKAAIRNMDADAKVEPLQDILDSFFPGQMPKAESQIPILVISNREKQNGAASILCPNALNKAAELLGGSIAILPSSIHEILAVRYMPGMEQKLKQMVMQVNRTTVELKDRLADSVYLYQEGKLSILA